MSGWAQQQQPTPQQTPPRMQPGMQPQQQGMYAGQQQQQPGMYQQPPGCCQSDPNAPPGCCNPAPGAQGGSLAEYYCFGPPPPPGTPETSFILQQCDYTTCAAMLFFLLSVIGFGCVLGIKDTDNIYAALDVSNTAEMQAKIIHDVPYLVQRMNTSLEVLEQLVTVNVTAEPGATPSPPTTHKRAFSELSTSGSAAVETTTSRPIPDDPDWTGFTCVTKKELSGSFGDICMEDALSSAAFSINLSRFNNFRGTLWFICMMGSFIGVVLIIIVHRVKNPPPTVYTGAYQPAPPFECYDSPLYHLLRAVWFGISIVVFLWISCEMYAYWRFVPFYKANTIGALHDFWAAYDKKFVPSVICCAIWVCWPLCNLAIEIGLWFAFIIPWYVVRTMKPGLEMARPELPLDELPGWIRLDMFFTEFNQFKRLGFSMKLWESVTGTKAPYLDCMDQQAMWQQQQMQQQQGGAPGGMMQPQAPPQQQMMMQQPQMQQQQQAAASYDNSTPPPQQQQQQMQTRGFQPSPSSSAMFVQGALRSSQNSMSTGGAGVLRSQDSGAMGGVMRSQDSFSSKEKKSKKDKHEKKDKKDKKDKKEKKDKKRRSSSSGGIKHFSDSD